MRGMSYQRDLVFEHRGAAESLGGSVRDSSRSTPRGGEPRCESCAQRPPSSRLPYDPIINHGSHGSSVLRPAARSRAGDA